MVCQARWPGLGLSEQARGGVGEGWATGAELDAMIVAFREWADPADAFASWLYCGALGWTSSNSPTAVKSKLA